MQHENGFIDIRIESGMIEIGSIRCLFIPFVISTDIQYATIFGVGRGDLKNQRI